MHQRDRSRVALAMVGLALSGFFGVRLIGWGIANWSRLREPKEDPLAGLQEMWLVGKWSLLGIMIFAIGWLWALGTSLLILSEAKRAGKAELPPRLARPEKSPNAEGRNPA